MSTIIPEISLISLQNQSESDLKILKEALNTHGFFTIIDHDIDSLLQERHYRFRLYAQLDSATILYSNIFSTFITDLHVTTHNPPLDIADSISSSLARNSCS